MEAGGCWLENLGLWVEYVGGCGRRWGGCGGCVGGCGGEDVEDVGGWRVWVGDMEDEDVGV